MPDDNTDNTPDNLLRGKSFDEVCILLEAEDDVKGIVYFKPAEGGKWQNCFGFLPNEYTEDELIGTINSEYGPGEYPVQFKSKDATGRPMFRWQQNIIVKARRLSAPTPAPSAAASSNDAGLAMIANAMAENSRILAAALEKLSDSPKQAPPPSTIEVAKDLAALKDLFAAPEKASPIESIKEVLEVMALLQNNQGGNDDPLTTALKTLLPAITKGSEELSRRQEQPARPGAPAIAAPVPAPVVVKQPVMESEAMNIESAYTYFTTNFLPTALQLARAAREPKEVADYLARATGASPMMVDVIGRVIAEDNMIERLAAANPDVMEFAAWFDEVADWLAHALWPETNPAPDTENATTDATNDDDAGRDGIKVAKINGIGDDDTQESLDADGKPKTDAHADTSDPLRNDET